jgi:regulation of enolase protein 1 (concanavalin A-like superfamily)
MTASLPDGWDDRDIGSVPIAGSASYGDGAFTVTGSGEDIWGTADAFHYTYQPVSGDVSVRARVASVQPTDQWSKAGVMIRETLTPGSAHAHMLVSAGKGLAMQWRSAAGADSDNAYGWMAGAPQWVRLDRAGDTITGFESADGTNWTTVATATIPMAQDVYVGIAVTSHSTAGSTTAVVDDLSVEPATGGA